MSSKEMVWDSSLEEVDELSNGLLVGWKWSKREKSLHCSGNRAQSSVEYIRSTYVVALNFKLQATSRSVPLQNRRGGVQDIERYPFPLRNLCWLPYYF